MVEESLEALGPGLIGADLQLRDASSAEGGDELIASGLPGHSPPLPDTRITGIDLEYFASLGILQEDPSDIGQFEFALVSVVVLSMEPPPVATAHVRLVPAPTALPY